MAKEINGKAKYENTYFYSVSQNAKSFLYYPLVRGHFVCDKNYHVLRDRYDSILFIYVLDGEISYMDKQTKSIVSKDEILMVNCYEKHEYFCENKAETLWIHLDGVNIKDFYKQIYEKNGAVIKKYSKELKEKFFELQAVKKENEIEFSEKIYSFLCCLLSEAGKQNLNENIQDRILKAKKFIENNYTKNLKVKEIADEIYMSSSNFSKLFRNSTGFSPYEYLLDVRLSKAVEMLKTTDLPVSTVAFRTGFNSTANFVYFFGKETGISPLKFRKFVF